jgi:hypothetical protein
MKLRTNKSNVIDRNRKAIAGLRQHYAHVSSIVLDGVPFKTADVEKVLQGQIDAADKTAAATASFHQAVAVEKAVHAHAEATFLALKARVFSDFKASAEVLGEFGLKQPTRRKPSPDTVVKANAQRRATRERNKPSGQKAAQAAPSESTAPPAKPTA